jgi:hypothetical protein
MGPKGHHSIQGACSSTVSTCRREAASTEHSRAVPGVRRPLDCTAAGPPVSAARVRRLVRSTGRRAHHELRRGARDCKGAVLGDGVKALAGGLKDGQFRVFTIEGVQGFFAIPVTAVAAQEEGGGPAPTTAAAAQARARPRC